MYEKTSVALNQDCSADSEVMSYQGRLSCPVLTPGSDFCKPCNAGGDEVWEDGQGGISKTLTSS